MNLRLSLSGLPWRWFLDFRLGRDDEPADEPEPPSLEAGSGSAVQGSGYGFYAGSHQRRHDAGRVIT